MKLKLTTIVIILSFITQTLWAQTVTLSGEITTVRVLSNDTIYILEGFVYVKDGGLLQIEEGTLIKGDKDSKGSLIVTRDGILLAQGTAEQPIIFTSNEPEGSRAAGDWGGILILGNAPINTADVNASDPGNQAIIEGGIDNVDGDGQYGGEDPEDSRGGMQYCRIEYPGIAYLPGNEINGLTLGGVGSGTILDHIQVSYSGDDAFEFFGGTVNASYLVANASVDDDFDSDFGYSGNLQFLVALRDPNLADVSGSNSFESDNDAAGSSNTPITSGIVSNATIVGPIQTAGDVINVNYKRGAHLRRNTKLSIFNSVIMGYPSGLMIDGTASETSADEGDLEVKNTILAGNTNNFEISSSSTWDIAGWFTDPAYENATYTTSAEVLLNDPYNYLNPDLRPQDSSPLLGAASFDDPDLGAMIPTSYIGAFDGVINWASCWTNWDPQNTDYSTPISGSTTATEAAFTYTGVVSTFTVNFANTSTGANDYYWDFGVSGIDTDTSSEINPSYTFPNAGSYDITLIAIGCSADTLNQTINVDSVVGIHEQEMITTIAYYPNPVHDVFTIQAQMAVNGNVIYYITDITGNLVMRATEKELQQGANTIILDIRDLSDGIYFITLRSATEQKVIKIVKSK
jgi:hypothetical protein